MTDAMTSPEDPRPVAAFFASAMTASRIIALDAISDSAAGSPDSRPSEP